MQIPIAVHVSPSMYCVFWDATANNPAGYSHVRVTDKDIKCCSKDCKGTIVKAKQQRAKKICMHIHVLLSSCYYLAENEGNSPLSNSFGNNSASWEN